jgi:hypothetical protein
MASASGRAVVSKVRSFCGAQQFWGTRDHLPMIVRTQIQPGNRWKQAGKINRATIFQRRAKLL